MEDNRSVKAEKTAKALIAVCGLVAAMVAPVVAVAGSSDDDHDKPRKVVRRVEVRSGSHGFLGVGVADVDSDRARDLELDDESGVEVTNVVDGSGAEKAGVKTGDVILEFNGQSVDGTAQFIKLVRAMPVGETVKLTVSRDGRTRTINATLGKMRPRVMVYGQGDSDNDIDVDVDIDDDDFEMEAPEPPEPPEPPEAPEAPDAPRAPRAPKATKHKGHYTFKMPEIVIPDLPTASFSWRTARLGVETEALGPQLAEYFGAKEGVLVRSVIEGSAAEKAGLRAGDVIIRVGDNDVSKPGDISSALQSFKGGESFDVTIIRNKRETSVTARLAERKSGSTAPRAKRRVHVQTDEDNNGEHEVHIETDEDDDESEEP